MHTDTCIKRHIFQLPLGRIFTTRELLAYGKRNTIDQVIYRLIKAQIIIRLARGVFVRPSRDFIMPTPLEIATIKAESFGKRIVEYGSKIGAALGLSPENQADQTTFHTSGSASSFRYGNKTIYFKKTCPRKLDLSLSKAGKAMAALWHIGKTKCSEILYCTAVQHFNRLDRQQLSKLTLLMPSWLSAYSLDQVRTGITWFADVPHYNSNYRSIPS